MTETCRRCHAAPGTERFYVPDDSGFSLAGYQPKFSAKRTVACDACWEPFAAYVTAYLAGDADRQPEYHDEVVHERAGAIPRLTAEELARAAATESVEDAIIWLARRYPEATREGLALAMEEASR